MSRIRSYFLVLVVASVAAACASLGIGVRERAEEAFRRQNHLSSEFMLAAPEIESKVPAMYESLLVMEKLMLDACQALNTLASKQRDNKPADFDEKTTVISSLEACEQATLVFEESLQQARQRTT